MGTESAGLSNGSDAFTDNASLSWLWNEGGVFPCLSFCLCSYLSSMAWRLLCQDCHLPINKSHLFTGNHLGPGYLNGLLGLNTDEILPLFLYFFLLYCQKSACPYLCELQESRQTNYLNSLWHVRGLAWARKLSDFCMLISWWHYIPA